MKTKTVNEKARAEKGSDKRQSTVISLRVSQQERLAMEEKATEEGMSLSEWCREVLVNSKGRGQGTLPWEEAEEEEDRLRPDEIAAEQALEFVEGVANSAASLAKGWLRCKAAPKFERLSRVQERQQAAAKKEELTDGEE